MLVKFILIYLLICKLALGYINIYPAFFYEKLENNEAFSTLVLTNTRNFPIRYRLYLEEDEYKDIEVEVYPKGITLKPFEKKEVKVLIKGDSKLNREFSKKLVVKEVEGPGERKKVLTMFKLKLTGFSGNLEPKLQIEELGNDKFKIKNIGNRVGIYNIYNSKEEFLESVILKQNEGKELQLKEDILIFEEKFKGKEMVKRGISNET